MKKQSIRIFASAIVATIALGLAACGGKSTSSAAVEAEHSDHDHGADHKGHDHADHEGHDHADHAEHVKASGPNGGRIIESVEPHLEVLLTDDRKLRITQLDAENQAVPMGTQEINAMLADRAAPTSLVFSRDGDSLLSNQVVPEGNMNPIVISIKDTADASQTHRIKFILDLADCPTCDYLEYACICDHDH